MTQEAVHNLRNTTEIAMEASSTVSLLSGTIPDKNDIYGQTERQRRLKTLAESDVDLLAQLRGVFEKISAHEDAPELAQLEMSRIRQDIQSIPPYFNDSSLRTQITQVAMKLESFTGSNAQLATLLGEFVNQLTRLKNQPGMSTALAALPKPTEAPSRPTATVHSESRTQGLSFNAQTLISAYGIGSTLTVNSPGTRDSQELAHTQAQRLLLNAAFVQALDSLMPTITSSRTSLTTNSAKEQNV